MTIQNISNDSKLFAARRRANIPELRSCAYPVLAEVDVPELAAFAPSAAAIDWDLEERYRVNLKI
jgi:hypothetical protein